MTKEEENLKIVELIKRDEIAQAIKGNLIFKKIIKALSENNIRIKINLDNMVDAFIDFFGLQKGDDFSIPSTHPDINTIISNVISSISMAENGVVINDEGDYDVEASINQSMMMQYGVVAGDLSKEEFEKFSKLSENSLNVNIFNEWEKDSLTESDIDFYKKITNGSITNIERYNHLQNMFSKNEDDIKDSIVDIRQTNFIETKDELAFVMIGAKFDSLNPEEKEKNIQQLLQMTKIPDRFKNRVINPETGRIDITKALDIGRDWKRDYIDRKRKQAFLEYGDWRENGQGFSALLPKDRDKILRSALFVFEDLNADSEMRRTAEAILSDISPKLLQCEMTPEGVKTKIDYDALINIYNSMRADRNIESIEELRARYQEDDDGVAIDKLERLDRVKEEDWRSRADLEKERTDSQNIDISKVSKKITLSHKKYKLKDSHGSSEKILIGKRISMALNSSRENNGTNPITKNDVRNAVLSAYITLRDSIPHTLDNLNNKEKREILSKRRALERIEKYILSNPNRFGNYIDEFNGSNYINDSKIEEEIDLSEYSDTSSSKYRDMQAVLGAVTKSDKIEEISKENPKTILSTVKDGAILLKDATVKILGKAYDTGKSVAKAVASPISKLFGKEEKKMIGPGEGTVRNEDGTVNSFDAKYRASEDTIKRTINISKMAGKTHVVRTNKETIKFDEENR